MTQYLMPTYSRQPVSFVKGEGVWLFDRDGNRYLDAVAGVAVCNLGHCHPAVTAAIQQQAAELVHCSNLYEIPVQAELAQKLCEISGMEKVFFGNSGAEANEAALKLARLHGHNNQIDVPHVIVMEGSFHGRTIATLSATGNRKVQAGFEPLVQGFVRAPFDDIEAVRRIAQNNRNIAAILVEPVQGEGGVHVPDAGYLKTLREICDEHNWLLMLDEIQTGNGRTGSYFAFQQQGFVPDVVTTAKGLGNGFPIGACLAQGKAAALFSPGHHGSTYGGNPLGCATALATVTVLHQDVIPQVDAKGEYLREQLQKHLGELEWVSEIRGSGLINAVQFDRDCVELVGLCRARGLLLNVTSGSVVRLIPPLVISHAEIDDLVARLADAAAAFIAQGAK